MNKTDFERKALVVALALALSALLTACPGGDEDEEEEESLRRASTPVVRVLY